MSDVKLSPSEKDALMDCYRFGPGYYVWKPKTMARLADKGFAFRMASCNAYALTQAGVDMVKVIRAERGGE